MSTTYYSYGEKYFCHGFREKGDYRVMFVFREDREASYFIASISL